MFSNFFHDSEAEAEEAQKKEAPGVDTVDGLLTHDEKATDEVDVTAMNESLLTKKKEKDANVVHAYEYEKWDSSFTCYGKRCIVNVSKESLQHE